MERKRWKTAVLVLAGILCLAWNGAAWTQQPSNEELLRELQVLKERVKQLEQALQQRRVVLEKPVPKEEFQRIRIQNERVQKEVRELSKKQEEVKGILEQLTEHVTISGIIEVEGSYEKLSKTHGERDENGSDIALATAELDVDTRIHEYVTGHMVFLWEEDDTEPVDIDEATITLGGTDKFPFYLVAGRFYPHFSEFNTYFISDPLTLELGEIQESAVSVGYLGSWLYAGAGAFNGTVSTEENDHINSWWVDAQVHNPEGSLGPVQFKVGAAYLSNMADTDTLRDEVPDGRLEDLVGGFSVFAIVDAGPFSFSGEYVSAVDDFNPGELNFAVLNGEPQSARPKAWNVEAAFGFLGRFQVGAKWEGTDDLFALLPETQYGVVFGWQLVDGATWSIEYLHGEYPDNDDHLDTRDALTTQLAIEF